MHRITRGWYYNKNHYKKQRNKNNTNVRILVTELSIDNFLLDFDEYRVALVKVMHRHQIGDCL